jgi:transcriptional regulator with XRE-family HTH domain
VPVSSGKMNERERMICARVKEFRKKIGWRQSEFAAQLGITLNQLASIEYGRTPLRYDVAWQMKILFKVALEWLSVGELGPADSFQDNLPPPESTGLPDSALLSDVSDKINGSVPTLNFAAKPPKKIPLDREDQKHRAIIAYMLREQIDVWISKVPQGYTADYCDKLFALTKKYLDALPKEADEVISARMDALMWDEMRRDLRSRLSKQIPAQKDSLTKITDSGNNRDVKAKLPALLKRLNEATRERGQKTELAKFMGVPLPNVSQWLSGDREPDGENTLRLLHWVEQQERQK